MIVGMERINVGSHGTDAHAHVEGRHRGGISGASGGGPAFGLDGGRGMMVRWCRLVLDAVAGGRRRDTHVDVLHLVVIAARLQKIELKTMNIAVS